MCLWNLVVRDILNLPRKRQQASQDGSRWGCRCDHRDGAYRTMSPSRSTNSALSLRPNISYSQDNYRVQARKSKRRAKKIASSWDCQ